MFHARLTKDSANRQAADFHHRPDLDGAYAGRRNPLRDRNCFVEISRIN